MKKYLLKVEGHTEIIELCVQLNLESIKNDCISKFGDTFRKFILSDEKTFLKVIGFEGFYNDNSIRGGEFFSVQNWKEYVDNGFSKKTVKTGKRGRPRKDGSEPAAAKPQDSGKFTILKSFGSDDKSDTRLTYIYYTNRYKNSEEIIEHLSKVYNSLETSNFKKRAVSAVEKYLKDVILPELIVKAEIAQKDLEIAKIYLR